MNGDTIGALVMVVIALALVVWCVQQWRKAQRRLDALLAVGLPADVAQQPPEVSS